MKTRYREHRRRGAVPLHCRSAHWQLFVQQPVELLNLLHPFDHFGVMLFFQQRGDMAQGALILEMHTDNEGTPNALSHIYVYP